MSNQRPSWFPAYGDPVRCPIENRMCLRLNCVVSDGATCEARDALALVPKDPPQSENAEDTSR
jgi:hypothetical protein